ncbi:hypothetical protein ACIP27_35365, partial [Streptomyces hydrogenans]|uniref:hypothetical protein n=1 Tax=Streptomyces hydrogenans TaxID=1873719 RepID=UPI00380A176A
VPPGKGLAVAPGKGLAVGVGMGPRSGAVGSASGAPSVGRRAALTIGATEGDRPDHFCDRNYPAKDRM